jgi:Animal haem peroxidase
MDLSRGYRSHIKIFDRAFKSVTKNAKIQLNEITPWLDGGLTYGTTKAWADQLRRMENGDLAPHGQLASANNEGVYPAYNTQRLPLANPPPPANHSRWIKEHQTAKVDRFFSDHLAR